MQDLISIMADNTQCQCLDSLPLAYSYVPMQVFKTIYDSETALSKGTVFPELFKPMKVYGKEFAGTARNTECMQ